MWYDELLLVLMAFLAVLMIVMAIMVASQRRNRSKAPEKVEEEEKVEKIFVEKGFEGKRLEPNEESVEEFDVPFYEPVIEQQEKTIHEPVPTEEPEEIIYEEPAPVISEPEPIIVENEPVEEEPEQVIEDVYEGKLDEYSAPETEPVIDEDVEITPVEPIILETEYKEPEYGRINGNVPDEPEEEESEPEYVEPVLYEAPDVTEPDESVVITPNQTFYDPVPEEETKEAPVTEEPPKLEEESPDFDEAPIEDIPEIELPPLEPDEPTPVPEEIEPDVEEEPAPEPVIAPQPTRKPRSRIRKPVIDESDPNLRVDLGVNTCPHCGSKVPDTLYCIYCGKPLNSNNVIEEKEEEI